MCDPIDMTEFSNSSQADPSIAEKQHLDALRRSEERYRALIEATTQAVWSWSAEKDSTDINRAQLWWEQLTGQSLEQQRAKDDAWLDVVHPEDREAAATTWRNCMTTGKVYDIEYRVRGREGTWKHVHTRGIPIRSADGAVREWVGTIDDVTDQRVAAAERERLLAAAESERRRLEEVFRHAPTFIAVLLGPDHVFERVNDRYIDLIGGRDVVGKSVREALPEVEGQGYFELLDYVYRTGQPHIGIDARIKIQRGEILTERILEFVYQPMLDANGKVNGVILQGIDLTERRTSRSRVGSIDGRIRTAKTRLRNDFVQHPRFRLRF